MGKIYFLALLTILMGCKKSEEAEQKDIDLIVRIMTTGQWKVSSFIKGSADITADFSNYKFQFQTNNTVDAINGSAVERTGTWTGDANARTITSGFNGANAPLIYLTGTFTVTNTTFTSVQAKQTVSGELRTLRLTKL